MEEVRQQRPCIQPLDAIDPVVATQVPRHPRVLAAGDLPPPPLRQVLCGLVSGVSHGPPPAPPCLPASEECGP
jgi:hypothetical protein